MLRRAFDFLSQPSALDRVSR